MNTPPKSYTPAELEAFTCMTWWEYAAQAGLPTSVGPRRIERGPYVAKPQPARDYLADDYLDDPWLL